MNKNNYKFVSIDVIANRITRHPLLKDINYEDIIAYTVDVLRLVSVPRSYVEESRYIEVVDYKAQIPDNCLNVKSVDYIKENANYTIPMIIATDSLHNHIDKLSELTSQSTNSDNGVYTYSLNNNTFSINQEDGQLFVVYDTLKCGEDGFPMIPDSIALRLAIENYIKQNVFSILEDLGKISGRAVQKAEQEYAWYIGKAQTEFQGFQNDDDLESFLRDFKRLFIQNTTHDSRGMYNVLREKRYKN